MTHVTLVDGRQVDSGSEEHRHECEARMVVAMPLLENRREYIEAIEKKRGTPAADRLRATMQQLWAARKQAADAEGTT